MSETHATATSHMSATRTYLIGPSLRTGCRQIARLLSVAARAMTLSNTTRGAALLLAAGALAGPEESECVYTRRGQRSTICTSRRPAASPARKPRRRGWPPLPGRGGATAGVGGSRAAFPDRRPGERAPLPGDDLPVLEQHRVPVPGGEILVDRHHTRRGDDVADLHDRIRGDGQVVGPVRGRPEPSWRWSQFRPMIPR